MSAEETAAFNARMKVIHADAVGEILDAVKAAGYSRPPAGDLRAQLLKLGRELKAETWDRGHSWTDDAEERAREVRAEIKSDIGRAILDALEGT